MSGEIIREWYFWLASIATGACMAFSYDLLRLFRRLIKHGKVAVDLEDLLYWIVWFCFSFALLYYGNNGVIRFAAVFGAAVGMLLYVVTIGQFFIKVSYFVIDKTIGNLLRLFRRLLEPIKRRKRAAMKKIRLTCATIHHNMKLYHATKAKQRREKRKYGRKKKKHKKDKKKNARVSSRQE
ncbi:MAG: spore cortex biosynthesis protein YabQ [Lachnospiraceae bacterium]